MLLKKGVVMRKIDWWKRRMVNEEDG